MRSKCVHLTEVDSSLKKNKLNEMQWFLKTF